MAGWAIHFFLEVKFHRLQMGPQQCEIVRKETGKDSVGIQNDWGTWLLPLLGQERHLSLSRLRPKHWQAISSYTPRLRPHIINRRLLKIIVQSGTIIWNLWVKA